MIKLIHLKTQTLKEKKTFHPSLISLPLCTAMIYRAHTKSQRTSFISFPCGNYSTAEENTANIAELDTEAAAIYLVPTQSQL